MAGDPADKAVPAADGVKDAKPGGGEDPHCGFQGLDWWIQLLAFVGFKDDEASPSGGDGAEVQESPDSEREAYEAELRAQLDAAREKLESSNNDLLAQLDDADGGLMEVWRRRMDLERENARLRMELDTREEELELAQEALFDLNSCLDESTNDLHASSERAKRAEAEVERLHEAMGVLQRQRTQVEAAKSAISHELVKAQTALEKAESDAEVLRAEVAFLRASESSDPKQILVKEAEDKIEHPDEPDGDISPHAVTPQRVELRPQMMESADELGELPEFDRKRAQSASARCSFDRSVEWSADEADDVLEEDVGQPGCAPIRTNGTGFNKARTLTWTSVSSGACTLPDHLKAWQEKRSSDGFVDPYQARRPCTPALMSVC